MFLSFIILILLQINSNLALSSVNTVHSTNVCEARNQPSGSNIGRHSCHMDSEGDISEPRIATNCYLWDDECTTAFAQKAAPLVMQRMSESGAEIEPLYIDLIAVNAHGVQIDKKNVNVYGFKNLVVDSLSFDVKTNLSRFIFHTNLYVTGRYKASGSIFSNPIFGDGSFRLLMKNVEVEIVFPYDIKKNENNEDVVEIKDYLLRYDVKTDAELELENFHDINKDTKGLHLFINKYWKMITEVYDPATFDAMVGKMVEVFCNYLKTVPVSSLVKF